MRVRPGDMRPRVPFVMVCQCWFGEGPVTAETQGDLSRSCWGRRNFLRETPARGRPLGLAWPDRGHPIAGMFRSSGNSALGGGQQP